MTEPTRDALHAETLLMLEGDRIRMGQYARMMTRQGKLPHAAKCEEEVAMYAYAAECVRKRAEMEAEVEALRAFASRQNDEQNEALDRGLQVRAALDLTPTAPIGLVLARIGQLTAAYAAATREGTDG